MHLVDPGWQLSVTGAVALAGLSLVLAPARSRVARLVVGFSREFTVVLLCLALWQRIGVYVHTHVAGARDHARTLYHLERAMGLPSELTLQHFSMRWPDLIKSLNTYYGFVHLNSMTIFLVWLWWRHRARYPKVRYTVIFSTLACFLIQIVPVAPPRMMTDLGFVDAALRYGQSVYGPMDQAGANQLAAMPSVHMDWAIIVGWYVWRLGPRGWRWIGPLHLVLTTWAVVGTANHWWGDGIVALGLVVLAGPFGLAFGHVVSRIGRAFRAWGADHLPRWVWPYLGIDRADAGAREEPVGVGPEGDPDQIDSARRGEQVGLRPDELVGGTRDPLG